MSIVVLNRKQIKQLNEIASHFKEINKFAIEIDHNNGIGPSVVVKFDLFEKNDVNVNITDYAEW